MTHTFYYTYNSKHTCNCNILSHTHSHLCFLSYSQTSLNSRCPASADHTLRAPDLLHTKQSNEAENVLNCLFNWQPPRWQAITVNICLCEEGLCGCWALKIQPCICMVCPRKATSETGNWDFCSLPLKTPLQSSTCCVPLSQLTIHLLSQITIIKPLYQQCTVICDLSIIISHDIMSQHAITGIPPYKNSFQMTGLLSVSGPKWCLWWRLTHRVLWGKCICSYYGKAKVASQTNKTKKKAP